MWMQYTDPFKGSSGGPDYGTAAGFGGYLGNLQKAAQSALDIKRAEDYFLTIEEKALSLSKSFTASIKGAGEEYRKEMSKIYLDNLEFGFAYDDSSKFITAVGTQMERLVPFSQETTKNALIFGKVIGETPENVGKLIGDFTKLGFSQKRTVDILNRTTAIARSFGVDAKKLTTTVGENIKLAQTYGFKNGIDGLTKMAAQAQRVGFSLKDTKVVADKILDGGIEAAITMASDIQALGGDIGALGDPFQLVNMAMYDMEGLQNQIVKASASAVQFNEETGDFKISGEEMLRLRQVADSLGLSYDQVSQSAINMRKEQEIASRITFPSTISEEQRNFASSLAEIGKGGEVTIDIPGFDEGNRTLQQLLSDNDFITKLDEYQKDAAKTPEDLQTEMLVKAKESLGVQEKMSNTLIEIQNSGLKSFENSGMGKTILDSISKQTMYESPGAGQIAKITNEIQTSLTELAPNITNYYTNMKDLTKNAADVAIAAIGSMKVFVESYLDITKKPDEEPAPTQVFDAFIPAGGNSMVKTGFGQILPNVGDQMLFSPGISDFFAKYNESEKRLQEIGMPKGGDLSMMYKSANATPNTAITDLMSKMSNISSGPSEIKQTVEIGGKTEVTLNINTNIPQNLISQVLDASQLKETIMNTVNDRLSAAYSDKLTNALITQKRG
jgi:hypothetical protein